MKKDMGGAATVLALAHMIMDARLQGARCACSFRRSRTRSPARPSARATSIRSRKGLTVEIGNTDAEGRLILADALALADEEKPELLIDMAHADRRRARRARPGTAAVLHRRRRAGRRARAPCREPRTIRSGGCRCGGPTTQMLDSKIADINNVATGGFAGSITGALFLQALRRPRPRAWLHFDIYAWNPSAKPGRPEGGECQAARALYALLSRALRLIKRPYVHGHQGSRAPDHHHRRAAAAELVHRQPARLAAVAGVLAAGLSRAAFRLPRKPRRGPAPRRDRHLRRWRRAARRRCRRAELG